MELKYNAFAEFKSREIFKYRINKKNILHYSFYRYKKYFSGETSNGLFGLFFSFEHFTFIKSNTIGIKITEVI